MDSVPRKPLWNQQLIVNHVWLVCCRHPVRFKWLSAIDERTPGLGAFVRDNSLCFGIFVEAYLGRQDMKRLFAMASKNSPMPLSAQVFRRVRQVIGTTHKMRFSMLSRS